MDLSSLKPAAGSIKSEKKRLGRGQGSGKGGTSARGNKGAKSRSGYSQKTGYEGGQMPLARRLPKFGFKNFNRKEYKVINISDLQTIAERFNINVIDFQTLKNAGLVAKNDLVKVLGNGELSTKLEVSAHAFSKSAQQAIESLEGKAIIVK
jgi:large subunit ribosomal protein L15